MNLNWQTVYWTLQPHIWQAHATYAPRYMVHKINSKMTPWDELVPKKYPFKFKNYSFLNISTGLYKLRAFINFESSWALWAGPVFFLLEAWQAGKAISFICNVHFDLNGLCWYHLFSFFCLMLVPSFVNDKPIEICMPINKCWYTSIW